MMCTHRQSQPAPLPQKPEELYEHSPMNPKNKKTTIKQVQRKYTGIEFLEDVVR